MVDLAWALSTPVFFLALSIIVCGLFATGGGDYVGIATRLQGVYKDYTYKGSTGRARSKRLHAWVILPLFPPLSQTSFLF